MELVQRYYEPPPHGGARELEALMRVVEDGAAAWEGEPSRLRGLLASFRSGPSAPGGGQGLDMRLHELCVSLTSEPKALRRRRRRARHPGASVAGADSTSSAWRGRQLPALRLRGVVAAARQAAARDRVSGLGKAQRLRELLAALEAEAGAWEREEGATPRLWDLLADVRAEARAWGPGGSGSFARLEERVAAAEAGAGGWGGCWCSALEVRERLAAAVSEAKALGAGLGGAWRLQDLLADVEAEADAWGARPGQRCARAGADGRGERCGRGQ